jgi:DNA (cytosine-5)-methyltransferase 1
MHEKSVLELRSLREKSGITVENLSDMLGFSTRKIYRWENGEMEPRKAAVEMLKQISQNKKTTDKNDSGFRFIDLFAGIGGLRKGFESIGGKCVFTSEWDLACKKTYMANYSCNHPIVGDITQIDASSIPEHDLLLAGFPCQPFSIAGVSKKNSMGSPHGFLCGTQGTLFFDVARIIAHHKPKAFLLENVKNLLSHDKGNTFRVIIQTLQKELGYNVKWKVINAKSYVPQNRERIFIVGFKDKTNFSFDDLKIPAEDKGPRLSSILHPQNGSEETDLQYLNEKGTILSKYTLSDKLWNYLQNYAAKHKAKGNGFGFGLCTENDVARTLSARYYKDGSEILINQGKRKRPRRLTPRECARLMGYDEKNKSSFKIPVSDTQAYKQFGNSVVVPVVKAVAQHMLPHIKILMQGVKTTSVKKCGYR